ncbi:hypothetical protein ACN47A_15145 [Myxococcus fulvus]|uniref:hypothetical protein n=1 Tax=Myxococcus fulvus TaxID=33 RepID=UPI003B98F265
MTAPRRSDDAPPSPAPALQLVVSPRPEGLADGLKKLLGGVGVVVGAPLVVFGLLLGVVGVSGAFSPDEGKKALDGVLLLLLAGVFVGVGRFAWKKGMVPFRDARRRELLFGFVRAQMRIRESDVAGLLKVSEPEARELLSRSIARNEVDLVYLSESREYVHRSVFSHSRSVARRCPACDAPVGATGVLPGDKLVCSYCQSPFVVA